MYTFRPLVCTLESSPKLEQVYLPNNDIEFNTAMDFIYSNIILTNPLNKNSLLELHQNIITADYTHIACICISGSITCDVVKNCLEYLKYTHKYRMNVDILETYNKSQETILDIWKEWEDKIIYSRGGDLLYELVMYQIDGNLHKFIDHKYTNCYRYKNVYVLLSGTSKEPSCISTLCNVLSRALKRYNMNIDKKYLDIRSNYSHAIAPKLWGIPHIMPKYSELIQFSIHSDGIYTQHIINGNPHDYIVILETYLQTEKYDKQVVLVTQLMIRYIVRNLYLYKIPMIDTLQNLFDHIVMTILDHIALSEAYDYFTAIWLQNLEMLLSLVSPECTAKIYKIYSVNNLHHQICLSLGFRFAS